MSLIVDEHRQYLADNPRVSAFRQALQEVVCSNDVVLDLGSGSGILGLLACQAGAKRVYSIEEGGMIELARAVSRANGFQDRMHFIKGFSTRVELPEKVDVAVCDQIGHFGFEAQVSEYFADVRRRLLKPEGKLIPRSITIHVAPVEFEQAWEQVDFWSHSRAGIDFRPARTWAANTGYPMKLAAQQLLGEPVPIARMDLEQRPANSLRAEFRTPASRAGVLHGLGGWFSAELSPSVTMTNSPLAPEPIGRRNVFLPIDQPVPVDAGDCIAVRLHIIPSETVVSWDVEVLPRRDANAPSRNGVKARFSHSTLRGMLISKEDLRRNEPTYVPQLTAWGDARRSILELCDGRRQLAEIEQEVYRRHAALFHSPAEAAAFVAEVITRYTM